MLHGMADILRQEKETWAMIETLDCGKPITESRADMDACADMFEYFGTCAEELETKGKNTEKVDPRDPDMRCKLVKEPIGVIAAVTPWNFPLLQGTVKVAAALAAGCSVVLKPSSLAPLTCMKIAELGQKVNLPAGVLNVLPGGGPGVGTPLCSHSMVNLVSYTGSGAVGEGVMKQAAAGLKPVALELGGKGAIVVFEDAPIEATVDWIMCGIFICAGQVCSATSRLIVQEGVKPKLMEMLVERAKNIKHGDPMLEDTLLGPMCSL